MTFPSPSLSVPTLAARQLSYLGLTMGEGTAWRVKQDEGLFELAAVRSGDQSIPRDSGQFTGQDDYDGRDITVDFLVESDGTSLDHALLQLATATVAQASAEQPLWFQRAGGLPLLCSMCRPRKRTMTRDNNYGIGKLGQPSVQFHANDPRLYTAGSQSTISLPNPAVQNLALNPSGAYDAPGATPAAWSTTTSGTLTFSTFAKQLVTGVSSVRMTVTAAASAAAANANEDPVPAVAGTVYSFGVQVDVLSVTTANVRLTATWLNASGGVISSASSSTKSTTGTATLSLLNQTAPAGTVAVALTVTVTSTGSGGAMDLWYNQAQIVTAATLPSYADGDTAGWAWAGVPGDSMSVKAGTASITNSGNTEMRPIVIFNGPLTNPGAGNESTGGQLVFSNPDQGSGFTVLSGDQLLVDLSIPHRALYYTGGIASGVTPVDVMEWQTGSPSWWNLPPGASTIALFSQDTATLTGTGYLQYASAYQL